MEPTIIKIKIPSQDKRLGRHIHIDSRSANYAFDTTGLTIKDVSHKRLITILDQQQLGSCTGNAGIGVINTSPFLGNDKVYTPDEIGAIQLYSDAEKNDGGAGYPPEDQGSSGLSIAQVLKAKGLISAYYHCYTLNDTLKAMSVFPVIFGTNWYSDMFNPDSNGELIITGNLSGGHEIELTQVDVENGRVWFDNSWSKTWGVNGRGYLTWEDFTTLLSQQGDVIVLIPPLLSVGSTGIAVGNLQAKLNTINSSQLATDGKFGRLTQAEVVKFQKNNNLVVDGVVGKNTLLALAKYD